MGGCRNSRIWTVFAENWFLVMIASTSGKNCLTFGGDPVQDTDFRSIYTFFSIAELGNFGDLLAFLV